MPTRTAKGYRLSQAAIDMINQLSGRFGISHTAVVEMAVRMLKTWTDAGWRPPSDPDPNVDPPADDPD